MHSVCTRKTGIRKPAASGAANKKSGKLTCYSRYNIRVLSDYSALPKKIFIFLFKSSDSEWMRHPICFMTINNTLELIMAPVRLPYVSRARVGAQHRTHIHKVSRTQIHTHAHKYIHTHKPSTHNSSAGEFETTD